LNSILLIGETETIEPLRAYLGQDPTLSCAGATTDAGLAAVELEDPALLIIDAAGAGSFEVFTQLKANPRWAERPVIFLVDPDHITIHHREVADAICTYPLDLIDLRLQAERLLRLYHTQVQQHLMMQQKLQQNLFHMLIHDMGNAVMMIDGALQAYLGMPPDSAEAYQSVQDASISSQLLEALIRDTLDVTRIEQQTLPLHRTMTNISVLLDEITQQVAPLLAEKTLKLIVDVAPDVSVSCDKMLIQRVILNVLVNAYKFSPTNTTITVQVTTDMTAVTIAISDQGAGIDPAYLPYIFDQSEQVRRFKGNQERAGYGLGMTFSRLAVEAHGGSIRAESSNGQGSTFSIVLPRS